MKQLFSLFLIAIISSICLHAQATTTNNKTKIKLSGYGYFMFGQVVSGYWGNSWESECERLSDPLCECESTFKHLWLNSCRVHLDAETAMSGWLTTKLGMEFYVDYFRKYVCNDLHKSEYLRWYKVYLPTVEGIMHWEFEHPILSSLKIESGLFPYTFNPQVKTLGNYLFRSTVHPVSVQNKLDYPWADFLGGSAYVGLFDNRVSIKAMLASEFTYSPLFDFTPAFTLIYKPGNVIDIGGGIAFYHAIQTNIESRWYDGENWQGTTIDIRAIFDPKPLLGGMEFIEKEGLQVYAELGFLGLKDTLEADTGNLARLRSFDTTELKNLVFPENSLLHRMPFMLGINVPTWKILDLLSIELEWFFSPYANDHFGDPYNASGFPTASEAQSLEQWDNYISRDNFKWAINMRKTVTNFEVRALIGSDHTIYHITSIYDNSEQTMKRPEDWHWFVQLRYYL